MVKQNAAWLVGAVLAALVACGPGLRDGTYLGDPRFTLGGTIENIQVDPNYNIDTLRMTVIWQMVAPPQPAPTEDGPATGVDSPAPSSADPNAASMSPTPASTPQPPAQPTISGQQGGAVNVAFPAPVSLVLYDTPLISPNVEPLQAEGTVVIYYDTNGDGRYNPPGEVIAAALQDYRLLFTSEPSGIADTYVDSILDNVADTSLNFTLASRRCDGLVEHLVSVPNTSVSLTPGVPTSCN